MAESIKPMPWFDPSFRLFEDDIPMFRSEETPKRHAACDECRQRKLKCSGEQSGCSRCVKQNLICHYSIQKQMGRPPKASRRSAVQDPQVPSEFQQPSAEQMVPYLAPDPVKTYEAAQLCPAIYKSFMMNKYDLRPGPFVTDGPIFEYQPENSDLESQMKPQWNPSWPDYSAISTPMLSSSTSLDSGSGPATPAVTSTMSPPPHPPTSLTCSCLSQLYLSLSSLSTLSSFPLSSHTLSTLYNAARVARSVIHCSICPQAFSTGVQNLMMLGTLLTVIADAWLRLTSVDAEALGKETVCASYLAAVPSDPEQRQEHWRQWLRKVIKHGVIGSTIAPPVHAVQSQCLDSPDLLTLIEELEQRQRVRHASGPHGKDSPMGIMPCAGPPKNEKDYRCLQIIGTARTVLDRFGFDPEDLRHRELYAKPRLDDEVFAPWK
ncbi:hypothetical protein VTO42DRAFT_6468 [Malbranchea cinnamomea]